VAVSQRPEVYSERSVSSTRTSSRASTIYGMKAELAKSSGLFLSEMHSSTAMIEELVGFDILPHPAARTFSDHLSTSKSTCCCVNAKSESVSSRPKTPQPAAVYRFTTAVRRQDNQRPETHRAGPHTIPSSNRAVLHCPGHAPGTTPTRAQGCGSSPLPLAAGGRF
jgi:hypothetical protein